MDVLVACHVIHHRLYVIESMMCIVHDLEGHTTLLACLQDTILVLVNETGITDDNTLRGILRSNRSNITRSNMELLWLLTLRTWNTDIDTVVTTVRAIEATVVIVSSRFVIITILILTLCPTTLTIALIGSILLSLRLVSLCTDSRSDSSTASHSDNRTDVTASPTTCDTANGRTENRTECTTYRSTLSCVSITTAQQQSSTYYP